MRGPVECGVEVMEPQVRLGRAGQVDGVAARVLVIAAVAVKQRMAWAGSPRSSADEPAIISISPWVTQYKTGASSGCDPRSSAARAWWSWRAQSRLLPALEWARAERAASIAAIFGVPVLATVLLAISSSATASWGSPVE